MPIKRLDKTRASLPPDYQYGDAIDPRMKLLTEQYGGCKYGCGRGITLCSAFPCAEREQQRAAVRLALKSLFPADPIPCR